MDSQRWQRIKELFLEVADLPAAGRRAALEARCDGDQALLDDVLELIERDAGTTGPIAGLELRDAGDAPRAGERLGAWRIVEPIARGGMGEVYLAERADGAYEQRVAIKVIRGARDPVSTARFVAERRTLARLQHDHIARLLDGGETSAGGSVPRG